MTPPFSASEFFAVFARYNQTFWPLPLIYGLGAVAAVLMALRRPESGRAVVAFLGFLWAWMAVAYHWLFFREINPAAAAFAGVFLAAAAGLIWFAWRRRVRLDPRSGRLAAVGWGFVVYALVVYPVVGHFLGHAYPAQPTFGLPCPTTIYTMGVLLWVRGRVPWGLLVIPALWSVIGFSAVWSFGVLQDAVLPVAGLLGGGLILWNGRRGGD